MAEPVDPWLLDRFRSLVTAPEELLDATLDEAALLVAAAAGRREPAWVTGQLRRLDGVAAACPPGLDGLVDHLFGEGDGRLGLRGDRDTYDDPANSCLDRVLDRRLGLPISLAVVAIVIGRRTDVPLVGVGMPGHFLVRHDDLPRVLLDPFDGGRRLTSGDCEVLVRARYGPGVGFDLAWLEPVGPKAIVVRILTNLRQRALATGDPDLFAWVATLRCAVPGVPADDLEAVRRLRPQHPG